MTTDLPDHPATGRLVDASLHLLDRQVLDRDGLPVLAVDDVELDWPDEGTPRVTRLLLGTGLLTRFFGAHQPMSTRLGIDWDRVTEVGAAIRLRCGREDLDVLWVERWWRDHVVARIPGGRHDPR